MKKTKMLVLLVITFTLSLMAAFSPLGTKEVHAKTTTYSVVARKGYKYMFRSPLSGKVKWSTDNKKVLKIYGRTNSTCKAKMLKNGSATLTAKSKSGKWKCKVTVKSGNAFVKAWCRQWVKENIKKNMDFKEKLITASAYVVSTNFQYGNKSKPEDVITHGEGTCISGGKLVAAMCEAMGYKARVRFAAKDDMSRYPANVIFMDQHYNVEVTVKGKKYYIDGTPGSMAVYLCNKKKTLFFGYAVGDRIMSSEEFMDIPADELF